MKLKNIITIVAIVAVLGLAVGVAASGIEVSGTFWALVPPVIAITLALITKEVYSSLFLGVTAAAIFACGGNALTAVDHVTGTGFIAAISGTAGIFLFLVVLGIIVALINKAGAAAAFGRWAKTHIKSRVGAQLASFFLGVLIFIDDYFNCLTVGSVMSPVADNHRISRAKLAYIIDATAAPICMIAPISSWAAAVSEYAGDAGVSGFELFIKAIPYNFYSLLTIVFVVAIIVMKADYGPMRTHERNAILYGDVHSTDERVDGIETESNPRGRVIDLLLPVIVLISISVVGMLYVGGLWVSDTNLIDAFGNTDATVALPWGGLIALVAVILWMLCRKLVTFKEAMDCIPKGFVAMVPAIIILTMATALKNISNDVLHADTYVEMLMQSEVAQSLQNFLPAVIFVVACFLAFASGTSWGTFGILIPIVTEMFGATDPLLIIGMSACLAGAVCGDHCSPISDTTIMSSAGARCVHVNHVSTQLPYAITVAAISFVCFLLAGFVQNAWICLAIGTALVVGFLFLMRIRGKKLDAKV